MMSSDAGILVFIHGGNHSASSWAATLTAIHGKAPDVCAFAVDLPGRGNIPGDLKTLTLDACADSVVAQINERTGPERRIVLLGHSLGGVVIPGVVNRLGYSRIERIVYIAACVPPAGKSVIDMVPWVVATLARSVLRKPVIGKVPYPIARFIFGNRATRSHRAQIHAGLCSESSALITEVAPEWSPQGIPLSWILPTHDRALRPRSQRAFATRLGGVEHMVKIDAGHELLITHPDELAAAVLGIVGRWSTTLERFSGRRSSGPPH